MSHEAVGDGMAAVLPLSRGELFQRRLIQSPSMISARTSQTTLRSLPALIREDAKRVDGSSNHRQIIRAGTERSNREGFPKAEPHRSQQRYATRRLADGARPRVLQRAQTTCALGHGNLRDQSTHEPVSPLVEPGRHIVALGTVFFVAAPVLVVYFVKMIRAKSAQSSGAARTRCAQKIPEVALTPNVPPLYISKKVRSSETFRLIGERLSKRPGLRAMGLVCWMLGLLTTIVGGESLSVAFVASLAILMALILRSFDMVRGLAAELASNEGRP